MSLQKKNWLHAAGRTDAATPPLVLVAGTGNWTPTRGGQGLFDITFDANSLIDLLERVVLVTCRTTSMSAAVVTASDTDALFRVSIEDDASTLTDGVPFDFLVIRSLM